MKMSRKKSMFNSGRENQLNKMDKSRLGNARFDPTDALNHLSRGIPQTRGGIFKMRL